MRKYRITIYIDIDDDLNPVEIIEAKNYDQANQYAMRKAHRMSNYGNGPFLSGWRVDFVRKGIK